MQQSSGRPAATASLTMNHTSQQPPELLSPFRRLHRPSAIVSPPNFANVANVTGNTNDTGNATARAHAPPTRDVFVVDAFTAAAAATHADHSVENVLHNGNNQTVSRGGHGQYHHDDTHRTVEMNVKIDGGNDKNDDKPRLTPAFAPEVSLWSVEALAEALEDHPEFSYIADTFRTHRICGRAFFELTHLELKDMGVMAVGDRLNLLNFINMLQRHRRHMPRTAKMVVPKFWSMVRKVLTFRWTRTSEGKPPDEHRAELTAQHTSTSFVSALLVTVLLDWTTNVQSYDMPLNASRWFLFFVLVSSALLFFSTVLSIIQMMVLSTASDELETSAIIRHLGKMTMVPAAFFVVGWLTMMMAWCVYLFSARNVGIIDGLAQDKNTVVLFGTVLATGICFVGLLLWARASRAAYLAKIEVRSNRRSLTSPIISSTHFGH